jgi:hypothetical protein
MTVDDPHVVRACHWFVEQGWQVVQADAEKIEAVMPSGYGSGPAIIDVIALVEAITIGGE